MSASPEERMRRAGGRTEHYGPKPKTERKANGIFNDNEDPAQEIEFLQLTAIAPASIQPRPWAYGKFLLFGSAAVLGAVDGAGKGVIAVGMALAMITGEPLLGERVWRTGPVVVIAYEDDEVEWHRRIAAACAHHKIDYAIAIANIHFARRPDGARLSLARQTKEGTVFPDGDAIIMALNAIGAVMLVVDPFNHAHELDDGNNNVMMAKVAGQVTRIAREANVAVLVLHHLRKGHSGQPDDLMGATSLRATFRAARVLQRMTPEEGVKRGINDPWHYIRIASSKENYAPPPEQQKWYRLISISLGNATIEYREGDEVAVATIWEPRSLFADMPNEKLAAVFEELRRRDYSPHKQAKNWAGKVLVEIGARSEDEATKVINAWLESGVLLKVKHYDAGTRHQVDKVVLNEEKVAEILLDCGYHATSR
jgi:hypothetical protein